MIALFSINEPLLDERILNGKLIRDCKTVFQEQVLVGLTTNGDLLTPTVADMLFESGLDILKISCYRRFVIPTLSDTITGFQALQSMQKWRVSLSLI